MTDASNTSQTAATQVTDLGEPTATYRDGTWVLSADGKARASFDFIGEGYSGDYDETDPNDAALYRLDVNVAAEYSDETWGEETDEPAWVYPSDGSICTTVHVEGLANETAFDLLRYAADSIADTLGSGTRSVKRAMDHLSYLPTKR